MSNKNVSFKIIRTAILLVLILLFIGSISDLLIDFEPILRGWSYLPISLFIFFFISLLILVFFIICLFKPERLVKINKIKIKLRWGRWLLFAFEPLVITDLLLFSKWGNIFQGNALHLWIMISTVGLMTWFITTENNQLFQWDKLVFSILVFGAFFSLAEHFQQVVGTPFPLYWSEGNRFWDYSLLFGHNRYLFPINKPIPALIENGRQFLWGLPFLLSGLSIQGMRLWDSILMSIPYALLGYILLRPYTKNRALLILGAIWIFIFISQGPIYTTLILAAILTTLAIRLPLLPELLIITIASFFASLDRNHWMIAPALWAILCVFVGDSMPQNSIVRNRWWRSLLIALSGFIGGYILPIFTSFFASGSVSSLSVSGAVGTLDVANRLSVHTLLWDRLIPSATNPLGIIPELLLSSSPLVILLIIYHQKGKWPLDFWKIVSLIFVNLIFLIVGLLVSVKIGGGNNLHNLDMFLLGLLFTASIAWKSGLSEWLMNINRQSLFTQIVIFFLVIAPIFLTVASANPINLPDQVLEQQAIRTLQNNIDATRSNGDVLFIDQRQLLTFGYIKNVNLVPDYEKKQLMNAAMENKIEDLKNFYHDLIHHRFSLIINEPMRIDFQGQQNAFGEENDAWVINITMPILCYYEPVVNMQEVGVELLVPREDIAFGFNGHLCPSE
jgi:hypothetical protein